MLRFPGKRCRRNFAVIHERRTMQYPGKKCRIQCLMTLLLMLLAWGCICMCFATYGDECYCHYCCYYGYYWQSVSVVVYR